jgi:iron complex transport system permease protein
MKLLVDVAKLEADGTITPQQAAQIRRAAATDTGTLALNVMATIGAFAVIAGLLAMRPTSVQVALTGLGLTLAGALIRKFRQAQLGFLGSALIVIGSVLLAAGLILKCSDVAPREASGFLFTCPTTPKWYGHMVIFLVAAAWLLAVGAIAHNGLLVALSAFAVAGALGSSTGYWHASYGLLVRESTVTIVVFALLGALATYLSMQVLQEPYAGLARLFALMALLWVNFGFWVGSLWGDYPLEAWIAPDVMSPPYAWDALQAWKAKAFFISRDVFSIVWALALAGVGAWGAMHSRRGAVNMAATFGGIHFYTQWFERLRATPEMVIAAGVIAVAIAFALWRYNQRQSAVVMERPAVDWQ